MCGPAALVPLAIASTSIAAAGTVYSGVTASKQASYQAKVQAANASQDSAAAADAASRGAIEEQRQYRKNSQILGAQRAALAANGVEVDFGSAADLQADTRQIGREDAATIRENTVREMKGFEISAANSMSESRASKAAGRAALVKTAFDAGSTILSGASQVGKLRAGR